MLLEVVAMLAISGQSTQLSPAKLTPKIYSVRELTNATYSTRENGSLTVKINQHAVETEFAFKPGTSISNQTHSVATMTIYVKEPGGLRLNDLPGVTIEAFPPPSPSTYGGVKATINILGGFHSSGKVFVAWPPTNQSGVEVKFRFFYKETGGQESTEEFYFSSPERKDATDAAIDARRVYAQPNEEGVLPRDPNGELQNVLFGSWKFKGGLFVGKIAPGNRDKSVVSRTQLYFPYSENSPSPIFVALTLTDLGRPLHALFHTDITVGAYLPDSNDTNLNTSEATVNWANRWNISPSDVLNELQGPSSDPDTDAVCTRVLSASGPTRTNPAYVTWNLTGWNAETSSSIIYPMAEKKVCLAMVDEADPTFDYNQTLQAWISPWRYFASREWLSDMQNYGFDEGPFQNGQPHLWIFRSSSGSGNWNP